jgi:hypothetical protein
LAQCRGVVSALAEQGDAGGRAVAGLMTAGLEE